MYSKKMIAFNYESLLKGIANAIRSKLSPDELKLVIKSCSDVNREFLLLSLKGSPDQLVDLFQTVRTLERSRRREALGPTKDMEDIKKASEILKRKLSTREIESFKRILEKGGMIIFIGILKGLSDGVIDNLLMANALHRRPARRAG